MARRPSTDLIMFIAETKRGSRREIAALRRALQQVLGPAASGRTWRLRPLLPHHPERPSRLSRYVRISGPLDVPPQRWDSFAFELAYSLSQVSGFPVQPDLPASHFAPPEGLAQPSAAGPVSASSIFAAAGHLPGSNPREWALDAILARAAWQLAPQPGGKARGEGITIAHTDTGYSDLPGIDLSSFDLNRDYDVLDEDANARDPLDQFTLFIPLLQPGHGTSAASAMVGSMIAGIQGAAPLAKVLPIRTVKAVWQIRNTDVAVAVEMARRADVDIIAMTLAGLDFPGLEEAIDDAIDDGILVLTAAGNFVPWVTAPASYRRAIAIGASNAADGVWSSSSFGSKVAFSAPGESVWALEFFFANGGATAGIDRQSGTTFATALTAGTAALWLAHHGGRAGLMAAGYPRKHLQALFWHMVRTVGHRTPPNWDSANYGVGIIDAHALLGASLPPAASVAALDQPVLSAAPAVLPPASGALAGLDQTTLSGAPAVLPRSLTTIANLFPALSATEVAQRLARLLNAEGAALIAKLDIYGPQLAWLFSERPVTRDAFIALAPAPAPAGGSMASATMAATPPGGSMASATMAATPPGAALIAAFSSPALRQTIQGG